MFSSAIVLLRSWRLHTGLTSSCLYEARRALPLHGEDGEAWKLQGGVSCHSAVFV